VAKRTKPICSDCGSARVLIDAYVEWDIDAQCWVVQNTFDKGSHCDECEGQCSIDWIEIDEKGQPKP